MMQLLSASNILKQAWAQYSKQFKAFREPLIWLMVPAVLSALLPIIPGTTQGTTLLVSFAYIVISIWATVRIIDTSWALHEGKAVPSSLTQTLAWGSAGRIVDYALVSILYALVTVAGFFLFIIPGILFMNWFAFAPIATLIEGVHGTGSLKRSKELVQGRFWPIAWRWIVINIVPGIIMSIITISVVAVLGLATGQLALAMSEASPWWVALVSGVISVVFIPFYVINSVILFAEARKTQ